ncbi:MAG TPA: intradiol ring-cleavage dioxygenase, partial [Blastocatellia bacterium]|nr:intradiol ring-cleavage dioxygenase [Blastocatellia bacterium]
MNSDNLFWTRRYFLSVGVAGTAGAIGAVGTGALFTPGVFAQKLIQTPRQTEGPFYPDKLPLDTDNDLLVV